MSREFNPKESYSCGCSCMEHPVEGRRIPFHSAEDGLKVPRKGEKRPQESVYDTRHILGWNRIK